MRRRRAARGFGHGGSDEDAAWTLPLLLKEEGPERAFRTWGCWGDTGRTPARALAGSTSWKVEIDRTFRSVRSVGWCRLSFGASGPGRAEGAVAGGGSWGAIGGPGG